jgi:predicted AlkP superfamily phosphohydrolase/phosphomutase
MQGVCALLKAIPWGLLFRRKLMLASAFPEVTAFASASMLPEVTPGEIGVEKHDKVIARRRDSAS